MTERALDIAFGILGSLISDPKARYQFDVSGLTESEINSLKDYFDIHHIEVIDNTTMIINVKRMIK